MTNARKSKLKHQAESARITTRGLAVMVAFYENELAKIAAMSSVEAATSAAKTAQAALKATLTEDLTTTGDDSDA